MTKKSPSSSSSVSYIRAPTKIIDQDLDHEIWVGEPGFHRVLALRKTKAICLVV